MPGVEVYKLPLAKSAIGIAQRSPTVVYPDRMILSRSWVVRRRVTAGREDAIVGGSKE